MVLEVAANVRVVREVRGRKEGDAESDRSEEMSHEPHEPHERQPDRWSLTPPSRMRLSFKRAFGASSLRRCG
jgi:hypothetical protein